MTWGQGKSHWKGLERRVPSSHPGNRKAPVAISQIRKCQDVYSAWSRVQRGSCLRNGEQLSLVWALLHPHLMHLRSKTPKEIKPILIWLHLRRKVNNIYKSIPRTLQGKLAMSGIQSTMTRHLKKQKIWAMVRRKINHLKLTQIWELSDKDIKKLL